MKNKCSVNYIVAVSIIWMAVTSCEKILEIPPNQPGQLVTDNVFTDSAGCVNGVVGIYKSAFSTLSPLAGYLSIYPSMSADDITSSDPFYGTYYNNQLTQGDDNKSDFVLSGIWNGFYGNTVIYQANAAIEGLTASKGISQNLRDQLIGECKVVRAISYFYLTNFFGPVPLALTSDYQTNRQLPRSAADEVYKQVIDDLTDASIKLKETYPSAGKTRPNKYTAMALLSRVYLYMQRWEDAGRIASDIINSGKYRLEDINKVFLMGNEEAIWQGLSTAYYNYVTQEGSNFVPYSNTIIPTFPIRASLLSSFEPTDLRKTNWTAFNTVAGVTYYYPYKYKNTPSNRINGSTEAEVVFRIAEQYLIRAEARIKLGDLTGGAEDINKIRTRAGLLPTTATTKDGLLAAVLQERRVELFCEWGHRWLDLIRSGLLNKTMALEKPGFWPADGHAALYPIPYKEVKLNVGWLQNPGY
jgi:hypothetical protein